MKTRAQRRRGEVEVNLSHQPRACNPCPSPIPRSLTARPPIARLPRKARLPVRRPIQPSRYRIEHRTDTACSMAAREAAEMRT